MLAFKNRHLFRVTIKTKLAHKLAVTNSVLLSIALPRSDRGFGMNVQASIMRTELNIYLVVGPQIQMFAIAFPRNPSITSVLLEKSSEALNTHDSSRFYRGSGSPDALICYSLLLQLYCTGTGVIYASYCSDSQLQHSRCNSVMIS